MSEPTTRTIAEIVAGATAFIADEVDDLDVLVKLCAALGISLHPGTAENLLRARAVINHFDGGGDVEGLVDISEFAPTTSLAVVRQHLYDEASDLIDLLAREVEDGHRISDAALARLTG